MGRAVDVRVKTLKSLSTGRGQLQGLCVWVGWGGGEGGGMEGPGEWSRDRKGARLWGLYKTSEEHNVPTDRWQYSARGMCACLVTALASPTNRESEESEEGGGKTGEKI